MCHSSRNIALSLRLLWPWKPSWSLRSMRSCSPIPTASWKWVVSTQIRVRALFMARHRLAGSPASSQTNSVLHYFARSPYYDATSNNAALMNQAMYNRNMYYIIQTRKAFEETLKTMPGLEFMVTHDPSENDTKLDNSGIWVIRKQIRHRRQQNTDAVTPISSYYVVGENIYMAPSFGNIISNRMVYFV